MADLSGVAIAFVGLVAVAACIQMGQVGGREPRRPKYCSHLYRDVLEDAIALRAL